MAQDSSAYDVLNAAFAAAGLPTLAKAVADYARQGLGSDEALLKLQTTQEYLDRFNGNALRLAKGMPVLAPDLYLSREESLRAQYRSYDLPAGFHDDNTSLGKMIGADVGAEELGQRLSAAQAIVTDGAMTGTLAYAQTHYGLGVGDLTAYFLDPTRSGPLLTKTAAASQIGAAAARVGFGDISGDTATRLTDEGLSADQATSAFSQAAALTGLTNQVADTTSVTRDDLTAGLVENNATALKKIDRAQADRKAQFAGGGGGYATSQGGVSGLGSANT